MNKATSDSTSGGKSALGLTCNIDQRGRKARMVMGASSIVLGVIMLVTNLMGDVPAPIGWIGGVLIVVGAFGVFEAMNGWCAVRAMGFKTKV
ncbi:MAG: hypothetical protein EA379_02355 [Phycisphaerales bacterium]|nr:MAG: hypothetical protein EA379_02355 [Phycisphaerales bacterium]